MTEFNLKLLEELCNAFGPSGFEIKVQKILKKYIEGFADQVLQDRTGSLIFTAEGNTQGPKIMIAGHVDEIGFQVSAITKEGYLKFHQLGGWWDQTLLSQRVIVKTIEGKFIGTLGIEYTKKKTKLDLDSINSLLNHASQIGGVLMTHLSD